MLSISQARTLLASGILEQRATASRSQRRAAFDNAGLPVGTRSLIDKVVNHADQVTDEDIAAAGASGFTEDQILEIVVCAAVGAASRQFDSALAALDACTGRV